MGTHRKTEQPEFLSGWKEIANYLGKGVRTVQRYERELSLPVRRPAGKSTGSVVATKAELDGWVSASPIREAFHLVKVSPNSSVATIEIRNGIADMRKLREQMSDLRSELRSSVQMLRESLFSLQVGLHQNRRRKALSPPTLEGISVPSALELLAEHSKGRKAS